MLVGGVVDDELGDDPDAAVVRSLHEGLELVHGAVIGADVEIFRNVVAVVLAGRRIEGQQPDGVDAEVRHVVELGVQPREVADAIVIGIEERLDVELIDDRVLVPGRVFDWGEGCRGLARAVQSYAHLVHADG